MERKNEAKRSLDFLRSSECYRNKILTDEKKKREMSDYIKRTLCLKYQSLAIPASGGISALLVTRMYRGMWGTDEDRNAKHTCSTL